MLCEACGKNPATVHITENPSDKENRKEIHLCEDCAREKGQVQEPSLSQMLGVLSGYDQEAGAGLSDLACPKCGMTYSEFRAGGRLGCPEDYQTFKQALVPFLEKIHGSTRHTGKSPAHLGQSMAVDRRVDVLRREMEKSIEDEDYERAADLRDRIRQIEEKPDGH